MQQQERDLISGLFDRLKPFESQPRDNEVEQFIWDRASSNRLRPICLCRLYWYRSRR